MELVPLGPGFGVEVKGVSILDVATDAEAYKAVRAAFEEHSLLVFHDQPIADDIQVAYSRAFGPLELTKVSSLGQNTFYSRLTNTMNGKVVHVVGWWNNVLVFLPRLVADIRTQAPGCTIEIHPLAASSDYPRQLAQGELDVVIGNWPNPPGDLHLGPLFSDEAVCLVSRKHPTTRRGWTPQAWLQAEHVAPAPARGSCADPARIVG